MARHRKEKTPGGSIKLRQPDRSVPSEKTLFDIAQERQLFQQAEQREKQIAKGEGDEEEEEDEAATLSPRAERLLEAMLWTVTLAMLHFTFDVLVQHQYGTEIVWPAVWARTGRAWIMFLFLFYVLHPHPSSPVLLPGLALRYQHPLRQAVFFVMSVTARCYLIYISNTYGYLATMKQAPPLGCLWLWAVVELDLLMGVGSLSVAAAFLWQGGYDIK
ncbi:hypothetical protein TOPH_04527 [Tolypocladium ophioglossoides CBS 100239]|uniref:DUF7719 domain-containing protein n=1 Tax=Tolypocladium ophioglossoides (strain CBS 100239) TaxID=1163406 RepID=A0A0L0NA26_TOLOC|nr:hypothetical protein TOPH_04527 [Tolypocladium ophioglossoides CBS 100239]